jgi:L-asparagine transporter-like permease
MNLHREDNQFLLIAIVVLIALVAIGGAVLVGPKEERTENTPIQEWCEVGTVNPDGSITYNGSAGTTELVAFATVNGPKLMAKCK